MRRTTILDRGAASGSLVGDISLDQFWGSVQPLPLARSLVEHVGSFAYTVLLALVLVHTAVIQFVFPPTDAETESQDEAGSKEKNHNNIMVIKMKTGVAYYEIET